MARETTESLAPADVVVEARGRVVHRRYDGQSDLIVPADEDRG